MLIPDFTELEILILKLEDNGGLFTRYELGQIRDARDALEDRAPMDEYELEELNLLAERI
jgi:hypothetical protein